MAQRKGVKTDRSVEEIVEVLKVSPQTVMRDWKMARAWLMTEIGR